MTKINHTKLVMAIMAQDRRDAKKKWYNIHALPQMLKAAQGVEDEQGFMDSFTPTRQNHSMAKKLGLKLDVKSGRWVMTEQMNEAVDGTKLIELLIMALQEGDTVRFNDCVNRLLSYKVSECLSDQRVLLASEMFEEATPSKAEAQKQIDALQKRRVMTKGNQGFLIQQRIDALKKAAGIKEFVDLVKNANTDGNLEPEDDAAEPEDQGLPNNHLTQTGGMDDQSRNFDEGRAQAEVFDTNRRELKTLVRKMETAKSPAIEKQIQARIDALKKRLGIKEEGSESDGRDTFRERAKPKSKKSSSSGQVGY